MSLPHPDACFVKAYPGEATEAFCDGHVSGFSFFGGVPRSILYDNTRIAVARILGARADPITCSRTALAAPARGTTRARSRGSSAIAAGTSWCRCQGSGTSMISTRILDCMRQRWAEQLRGHDQTVGERLERDRAVLQRLPAIAYDACDKRPGRVSSLSLVRYGPPPDDAMTRARNDAIDPRCWSRRGIRSAR